MNANLAGNKALAVPWRVRTAFTRVVLGCCLDGKSIVGRLPAHELLFRLGERNEGGTR